ncbi:hypothetical protein WJX81_004335 [Elliptochloris bilobata]|uniref:Uncharacterized protein n=1 Tax=Elliptochloris bilobata TaxID=381761 RepID=A0AAW1RUL3_9CHLO
MEVLQEELLGASAELLDRVYAACQGLSPLTCPTAAMFATTYYEVTDKLVTSFPLHPLSINVEKVDRLGSEVLWREAARIASELEPLYGLLQDLAEFKARLLRFLAGCERGVLPFCPMRSPELLAGALELVANATRLHLLAAHLPAPLILQLHTLAHCLASVQRSGEAQDPPDAEEVRAYARTFPDALPLLQAELQPVSARIGQMLETGVFPALLAFGSCDALGASGLADLSRSDEALAALAYVHGWTREAAWRALAQLPHMCELTLLILLVCPGEAIRPGGVEVVHGLLSETLLLLVYNDVCTDVHAHFQRLVQPTLSAHSRQRGPSGRSMPGMVRAAHAAALAGCQVEHRRRRELCIQALTDMVELCGAPPPLWLTVRAEGALAVLAYARAELLWWFRHWKELPSGQAWRAWLAVDRAQRDTPPDASVHALMAAFSRATLFLLRHGSAVQAHAAHALPLAAEDVEAAAAAAGCEAFCGGALLAAASALLQQARLAEDFLGCVHRAASLAELRFQREAAAGRPPKLRAAMLTALSAPYTAAQHAPAWLTAICSLAEPPTPPAWADPRSGLLPQHPAALAAGAGPGEGEEAVQALAGELMAAMGACFEHIVAELHQASLAAPDGLAAARAAELASLQQAGRGLARALAMAPAVRVTRGMEVRPREHLLCAARNAATTLLLAEFCCSRSMHPRRPSELERSVAALLAALAALQRGSGADLAAEARAALLAAAGGPLDACQATWARRHAGPERRASGGTASARLALSAGNGGGGLAVASALAEWYANMVLADQRCLGVAVSEARGAFFCTAPVVACGDPGALASALELAAAARVFGAPGLSAIARAAERPMAAAVAGLDAALAAAAPLLETLQADYEASGCCGAACGEAAADPKPGAGLPDLDAVLELLGGLARAAFFRRLVAAAAHAELAAPDTERRGAHICDALGLPRPAEGQEPSGHDPVLARLVAGMGSPARARRWASWPLLAALTLWAPAWAATLCVPAQDALSGAGAGLAPAARALAAAVPAAFGGADGEGLGSRSEALRCLVRCGSAAAQVPPAEPKLRALAALAGSDLRFGAAGAWAA